MTQTRKQKILAVIKEHYVQYDGFSQDDSWHCHCNKSTYGGQPYRTRAQAEEHVAQQIDIALTRSERPVKPSDDKPFWKAT